MKAHVDPDKCTGCTLCTDTCPEVFEMKDGIAVTKQNGMVPVDAETAATQAAAECPSDAITIEK